MKDLIGFDRSLPMSLLRAREVVMKEFIPHLKEHDLTAQQWRVIRSLQQDNGIEIKLLAERCFLLMPSLSRILQTLEKSGLVTRQSVKADQRRSVINLTEAGFALYEIIAPQSAQRYDLITQKFGYGKLELLYELLDELIVKLDKED